MATCVGPRGASFSASRFKKLAKFSGSTDVKPALPSTRFECCSRRRMVLSKNFSIGLGTTHRSKLSSQKLSVHFDPDTQGPAASSAMFSDGDEKKLKDDLTSALALKRCT